MTTQAVILDLLSDLRLKAPSGFAMAFHIRYTTPLYLFQTYAKEWIAHYSQNGLVMQDPIVGWSFANNGTIRWSDLRPMDSAGVLDQARAHGMAYGIACGMESGDSKSVAGFARADREFTDDEIADIVAKAQKLHDLTATIDTLDAETRGALRQLSIEYTHP